MTTWRVYDCGKTRTIQGAEVYWVEDVVVQGVVVGHRRGATIGYSDDAGYGRGPEDVGDHCVEATKDGWYGHYSGIDPHFDIHIELCGTESVADRFEVPLRVLVKAISGTTPIYVDVELLDYGVLVGTDHIVIDRLGVEYASKRFVITAPGAHEVVARVVARNPYGEAVGESAPKSFTL